MSDRTYHRHLGFKKWLYNPTLTIQDYTKLPHVQILFHYYSQVGLEKLVVTCEHRDKLGNSVCEFLQWFSKLSTAQIHSKLKHSVCHMEIPCLRKLELIIVDDPSY